MLNTEMGRPMGTLAWKANQPGKIILPPDTGLKRLNIRLNGSFQVTYASGSPVFDVEGVFSKLVPSVQVALDGNNVVKSASPFEFQQLHYMLMGQRGEQRYTTQAGAFTTRIAGTDGRPGAFPATTQRVLDNECITLYFENLWAYGYGADLSILNLMGQTNPVLTMQFASYGALQDPNSSAVAVTYADDLGLTIDVAGVEAQDVKPADEFVIFREYGIPDTVQGQVSGRAINLNVGNNVQGIMATVRNGDATKTLSNTAVTRFQLRLNGRTIIRDWPALLFRAENQARRAIYAPSASGVTNLDGTFYMPCMKNGDIRTSIDLSPEAGVKQAQVLYDTALSSGVDPATYTAGVDVRLVIQELIFPAWFKKQVYGRG